MKNLIIAAAVLAISACSSTDVVRQPTVEKIDCKARVYYSTGGYQKLNFKVTTQYGKVMYRTRDPFILYPIEEKFVKIISCKEMQ